jgi:hypothetical protein
MLCRAVLCSPTSGHNGCLDCFSHVRSYNPECPLCRKSFDPQLKLSCNHELRDLIALKKRDVMDDEVTGGGHWQGCLYGFYFIESMG